MAVNSLNRNMCHGLSFVVRLGTLGRGHVMEMAEEIFRSFHMDTLKTDRSTKWQIPKSRRTLTLKRGFSTISKTSKYKQVVVTHHKPQDHLYQPLYGIKQEVIMLRRGEPLTSQIRISWWSRIWAKSLITNCGTILEKKCDKVASRTKWPFFIWVK